MLTELWEPGFISTADGIAVAKNGAAYPISSKETYPEIRGDCNAWPPLRQLDFMSVLVWARRTSLLDKKFAVTKVERALAGYTHVIALTWVREGEVLFRAMQALEAFYCDGSGDLRKQLSDKTAIWLGAWNDKRNIVGHLYDLRSKFIHGAAKLQYSTSHGDAWTEDERHAVEFAGGVRFAVRLLLSTLQKCIVEDVVDVQWSYSVRLGQ